MTIAVLQLELFIPAAHSLKSKRSVVKGLKEKIRRSFNVSVAEIAGLDKWQRTTLAVAGINNDRRFLNSLLCKIVNLVESEHSLELIDYEIEIF